MFLKLFLFAIILNCAVRVSCDEPKEVSLKQATIEETENESNVETNVDLSTIGDNSEITVPLNESLENVESTSPTETIVVSESSTETTLNDTDVTENVTVTDDLSVIPTILDNTYNYDNDTSTYNATDSTGTGIDGENTETFTEDVTEVITVEVTDIITDVVTEPITDELTVNNTEESTVNNTEESTVIDAVTESTTTTTTELPTTTTTTEIPTTPIDILCPQIPESEIDLKYRNETFDLYLEEFMKKNPLAKIYKSPGFPGPYAENLNCTLSVTLPNCTGIDVVIHYLNLNPFQPDTLNIRGGEEDALHEIGKKLTGRRLNKEFMIIHTASLYIQFNSGPVTDGYQGFLLTYSPYGNDTVPPTTTETPITIPPSEVEVYEVQLVLPEISKINETWQIFKEVLASSASKYVADQNLNYESAHPDNVTMDIFNCPSNWPNYRNCVRLQFSISLWSLDYDPDVHFDLSIFDYELSTNSLSIMWDLYGRDDFAEILQIEEYSIPDGNYILLLWTGISLAIVVIFIGVLYSIWRIDIFREYRRMQSKSDDQQDILKEKSELDISMYPIPHQPYPTLFETNEMNSGGYYDSYEINSTSFQGHNFNRGIHQEKPNVPSNNRHANNPFSPNIIDFNDTQLFPDDEDDFGRVQTLSPRSKQKLILLGAKRDESNS